ncbi:unnamed protein product [Symbiodinium microadriaticum]|nr:unnamed protein product [Symbiodinium microadriaticum]
MTGDPFGKPCSANQPPEATKFRSGRRPAGVLLSAPRRVRRGPLPLPLWRLRGICREWSRLAAAGARLRRVDQVLHCAEKSLWRWLLRAWHGIAASRSLQEQAQRPGSSPCSPELAHWILLFWRSTVLGCCPGYRAELEEEARRLGREQRAAAGLLAAARVEDARFLCQRAALAAWRDSAGVRRKRADSHSANDFGSIVALEVWGFRLWLIEAALSLCMSGNLALKLGFESFVQFLVWGGVHVLSSLLKVTGSGVAFVAMAAAAVGLAKLCCDVNFGSAFSLPMEWRPNLSRAPCQPATRSPNSSPGSALPVGRILGLGLGIGVALACRAPRRAGRKMHSRTRAVKTVDASTNPSLVLRLPTYDIATEKFYGMPASEQEEILLQLRALVTRYELEQVVGVDIKHRHFEMLPRHVLLESQRVEAKESVMRPAAMSEPMTPFSFVLMDGKWMPYEFVEEHCHSAQLGLTKVARCGGFLQELSHYLAARGLEDVFGFHVLHREHLSGEARGTLETPGRSENELLIRCGDPRIATCTDLRLTGLAPGRDLSIEQKALQVMTPTTPLPSTDCDDHDDHSDDGRPMMAATTKAAAAAVSSVWPDDFWLLWSRKLPGLRSSEDVHVPKVLRR